MSKKVLCCASQGGHWVQLRRLDPAWQGMRTYFISTAKDYKHLCPPEKFYCVTEANLNEKLKLIAQAIEVLWIIIKIRPNIIISTGASVGYFAFRFGKLFRAKTIWLDSIANAEELSVTGKHIAPYADLYLTQWEHLEQKNGPYYKGKVM